MEQKALHTPEGREFIMSHLRMGPMKVTFTKKDGTERIMNCTLQEGVMVAHEKTTDRVKEENTELIAVWDLDKQAWRSFRLDSIKSIEFNIG